MIPAEAFQTHSLLIEPREDAITRILAAAIAAVEPGEVLRRGVRRDGNMLLIHGERYDLREYRRISLLGIGKASVAMSSALAEILGGQLATGLVVTKHAGENQVIDRVKILEGGHPVPNENSLQAGVELIQFLDDVGPRDLLFCLISGGGSALVTAPVGGVTLADMQALTSSLLACGATIQEINSLRRRLDSIKGGGLARLSHGATIVSLILSDVVGNPLEAIASGPTAPDPVTKDEVLLILGKYLLEDKLPESIMHVLRSADETPKPGDQLFDKVRNILVGSNLIAAQGALKQAEEEGFHPYLLRTDMRGEAREAAFTLATLLRQAKKTGDPIPSPACIIAGGETTVTLKGNGKGGRNTELALAAVIELADFPGVMLVTLATDGEDGPTDAAGAVVNGATYQRAREMGLNAGEYLGRNDSYTFFERLGDLVKTGSTGTNVNDLTFLFTF